MLKKQLITSVKAKTTKMASPPVLGIGLPCTFLSAGSSRAPNLAPSLPARGVSTMVRIRATQNMASSVVIDICGSSPI